MSRKMSFLAVDSGFGRYASLHNNIMHLMCLLAVYTVYTFRAAVTNTNYHEIMASAVAPSMHEDHKEHAAQDR